MQFIWLIFAAMFFVLSGFHFYLSLLKIEPLKNHGKIATTNGAAHGTKENMEEVNNYINETNVWNKRINLAQGAGYCAAALTAVFSYFLS